MKRRGFTLIELMVVIAIIIILAAIAIPNYLTMTARAKKSRVASDFAALATALETYRTDWNHYPVSDVQVIITGGTNPATIPADLIGAELDGDATKETATGNTNFPGNTTAGGDSAPIEYMAANILTAMVNPYSSAAGDQYYYSGNVDHWLLTARTKTLDDATVLSRTDTTPTVFGQSNLPTVTASGG